MIARRAAPRLSVNVNKIATVRNSRGGSNPSVVFATRTVIAAGAAGVTVHPRADARHITFQDVHDVVAEMAPHRGRVEFNIEGDPRPDLVALVCDVRPDQCTIVPVHPGEITSQAGWPAGTPREALQATIERLRALGIRVSRFVEADAAPIRWAADMGADRVELYTEPFARAFERGPEAARASFARYCDAALRAHDLGLGLNAGHDLDLDNLVLFRTLPHLAEVSIGHALISHALFVGLDRAVRDFLRVLNASLEPASAP
jgi:pyridoxine 5-phosphate synthase